MSDWPPRFKITPEGAAGMFLLAAGLGAHSSRDTQERLAALLTEFYNQGKADAEAALTRERDSLAQEVDALREALRELANDVKDHIDAGTLRCEICADNVERARRLIEEK